MKNTTKLIITAIVLTACQIFCIDITDEMNETMGPSIDGSIEQTLLLTTYVDYYYRNYLCLTIFITC